MIRRLGRLAIELRSILCWLLAAAPVSIPLAVLLAPRPVMAAEQAAGVLIYQQVDATTYRYNVDLKNTGTTDLRTLWYAWIPGADFLPEPPTNLTAPTGWTANLTHLGGSDGYAIQWINQSGPLASDKVLDGFGFDSHQTPAQLSSSQISPTFVYGGVPSAPGDIPPGDAGFQFDVTPPANPWQNPFLNVDVNNVDGVTTLDVLNVINALNNNGGTRVLGTPTVADTPFFFLDVNDDGKVKTIDALNVVNYLNSHPAQPGVASFSPMPLQSAFAAAAVVSVPEPTSGALAALGFIGLVLRYRKRHGLGNRCPAACTPGAPIPQ